MRTVKTLAYDVDELSLEEEDGGGVVRSSCLSLSQKALGKVCLMLVVMREVQDCCSSEYLSTQNGSRMSS